MKDIELTSAHDMKVDDDFHIIEGRLEVLQSTKIVLLFIQGEWVFNFLLGIPWLTDMFDIEVAQIEKRKNIVVDLTNVIDLRRLISLEYNVDEINKGALVRFSAETTYGPLKDIEVQI